MRLRWQDDAIVDMRALQRYIAKDNPEAAIQVARRILQAIARLPKQPALGKPGRVLDTRELVISGTPYIAAYRVDKKTITILRVIHTARQWPIELLE
jgi:addiction module RelE/StbE family toxin